MKEYPKRKEKSTGSVNGSESKGECVVMKPWGQKEETYPAGKFKNLSGKFSYREPHHMGEEENRGVWAKQSPAGRHR